MKHASNLADTCAGIASGLSYNEPREGTIKHTLREASYFIDSICVKVKRKGLRWSIRNARGSQRQMRLREVVAYYILGKRTHIDARPTHHGGESEQAGGNDNG